MIIRHINIYRMLAVLLHRVFDSLSTSVQSSCAGSPRRDLSDNRGSWGMCGRLLQLGVGPRAHRSSLAGRRSTCWLAHRSIRHCVRHSSRHCCSHRLKAPQLHSPTNPPITTTSSTFLVQIFVFIKLQMSYYTFLLI